MSYLALLLLKYKIVWPITDGAPAKSQVSRVRHARGRQGCSLSQNHRRIAVLSRKLWGHRAGAMSKVDCDRHSSILQMNVLMPLELTSYVSRISSRHGSISHPDRTSTDIGLFPLASQVHFRQDSQSVISCMIVALELSSFSTSLPTMSMSGVIVPLSRPKSIRSTPSEPMYRLIR